jgi:cbb3-type cytochrome oxidase cytochrome c subunit
MRKHTVLSTVAAAGVGLVLTAAAPMPQRAHGQDRPAATAGAKLFMSHGCYGCHRVGALGTPIGPDLSRVGAKYAESDLVRWLSDPASQKPNAHMPKLDLSAADVSALAAFLAAQR